MKQAGISPLPLKKDTTEIAGQNISKALKQNAAKPVNQNATKQAETAVVPGGRISAGMSQLKQRYDEKNDEDNADAISPEERSIAFAQNYSFSACYSRPALFGANP